MQVHITPTSFVPFDQKNPERGYLIPLDIFKEIFREIICEKNISLRLRSIQAIYCTSKRFSFIKQMPWFFADDVIAKGDFAVITTTKRNFFYKKLLGLDKNAPVLKAIWTELVESEDQFDLMKYFAEQDKFDLAIHKNLLLGMAVAKKDLGFLRKLLKKVDPRIGYPAILEAARVGDLSILQELLKDERIDPAINENAPLKMASREGHLAIVQELLKHEKVKPSDYQKNKTFQSQLKLALEEAKKNNHQAVVDELNKFKKSSGFFSFLKVGRK